MVVHVLIKGHVRGFVSLLHPLDGVADVGLNETVSPVDGEGFAAVNCHVQLPCHAWNYKCVKWQIYI